MKNILLIIVLSLYFNSVNAQVGIGTADPKSTLDINGNLSLKVVSLNGGPSGSATPIDDGVYINLTPTVSNEEFILPDATTVPGRIYVLRNIADSIQADIYTFGAGVEFFAGDSTSGTNVVNMTTAVGGGNANKTLIFISDGSNWTYGKLGF